MFLDKIHLFNGLDQDQLAGIAAKLEEREVSAGKEIFKRGSKPDGFYMVFKGKVKVTVFNNSQLGNERELLQKLKIGTVDFSQPSTIMSTIAPSSATITGWYSGSRRTPVPKRME